MCDDQAEPVLQQFLHALLNVLFRDRVDRRSRFIHDQNLWISQYGACKGDELFLPR